MTNLNKVSNDKTEMGFVVEMLRLFSLQNRVLLKGWETDLKCVFYFPVRF